MEAMHVKFPDEFRTTSGHTFRQGDDMQLAFTYYQFLANEKTNLRIGDIFDRFDVDHSDTWSDREIRTLLARIYPLPIYLETMTRWEGNADPSIRAWHL